MSTHVIDAEHLAHQRDVSQRNFGPHQTPQGVLDHIRKELDEIANNPDDITEWADLLLLAFDGAMRAHHEPQDIIDAIKAKQAANEQRTWPDWRTTDPDKAIEHVREVDLHPTDAPTSDDARRTPTGEQLYAHERWSGCDGSAWDRLPDDTQYAWNRTATLMAEVEQLRTLSERVGAAFALVHYDAHPVYGNTAGWRGGIGGATITQGCSIIDPPPDADWTQLDVPSGPLREYLSAFPFDLDSVKEAVKAEFTQSVRGGGSSDD